MGRPQGRPQDFMVHQPVRYKPGVGTYGYEEAIEVVDGRIPAIVVGHSPAMVRITFSCGGREITRPVAAASLVKVEGAPA